MSLVRQRKAKATTLIIILLILSAVQLTSSGLISEKYSISCKDGQCTSSRSLPFPTYSKLNQDILLKVRKHDCTKVLSWMPLGKRAPYLDKVQSKLFLAFPVWNSKEANYSGEFRQEIPLTSAPCVITFEIRHSRYVEILMNGDPVLIHRYNEPAFGISDFELLNTIEEGSISITEFREKGLFNAISNGFIALAITTLSYFVIQLLLRPKQDL
jgi:hypothetical protein